MSKQLSIPVWSNVLFLIPAIIAAEKDLFFYALLIILAASVSFVHHQWGGKLVSVADHVLATSVILANLYILYLADFRQPNFAIALVFVAIAFYFFFKGKNKKYDIYHGLWHVCSVIITLLCVLA